MCFVLYMFCSLTTSCRGCALTDLSPLPRRFVCDTSILVVYTDLLTKLGNIRKACEASFPQLLSSMHLLPLSEREMPELNSEQVQVGAGAGAGGGGGGAGARAGADSLAQILLAQTWDVVDSPLFSSVCTEAIDTCFRHIHAKLRARVFLLNDMETTTGAGTGAETEAGAGAMRTPPIASLLPQLKAIAKEMLPAAPASRSSSGSTSAASVPPASSLLTAEVRDIASGAALDTLCVAIFDAA